MKLYTIVKIVTSLENYYTVFFENGIDEYKKGIASNDGIWIFEYNDLKSENYSSSHEIYFYYENKSISHKLNIEEYIGKYYIYIEFENDKLIIN